MLALRKIVKNNQFFILPIIIIFAKLFYSGKYIQGRHFESSFIGLRWVFRGIWRQKILGFNRNIPWPCGHAVHISNPNNIEFDANDLNNFQSPGIYLQNIDAKIFLKKGCYIAPNVGIITSNHKLDDLNAHNAGKDVTIGEDSWVGMNAVILPGVTLGKKTIVGAGAIVTKSFPEGYVVVAGNPARIIKNLPQDS